MFKKEEKDNPRRYLREKLVSVSDWASLELIPTIFKNYSHETTRILNSDQTFNNNNEALLNFQVLSWYNGVFINSYVNRCNDTMCRVYFK